MALKYISYKDKWVLKYKDPWSGRPRVKSWRGLDKGSEAESFERFMAEQYAREKELIRRARRRASSTVKAKLIVTELVDLYTAALSNSLTQRTTREHMEPLIAIFGQRKAHCLTCEDIYAWMEVQRGRGVGTTTITRRVGILRAAYNWGVRFRHLSVNPLTGLRLPSVMSQRIMPPSICEARLLYNSAAPHVQRVIALGISTGARIGPCELFRLRWSDVDMDEGVIRMPNAAKGALDEARDVPIRDDILGLLRQWQKEDETVGCPWVIHYRGNRVRSISKAWHNALRRSGIARRIRPYDLRHAFPSASLAHGADIKCVAEVMGHKDASMLLKIYQHTLFRERRRAVNAAPGLLGGAKGRPNSSAKRTKKKRPGQNVPGAPKHNPDNNEVAESTRETPTSVRKEEAITKRAGINAQQSRSARASPNT